jgi:hypothetical protein
MYLPLNFRNRTQSWSRIRQVRGTCLGHNKKLSNILRYHFLKSRLIQKHTERNTEVLNNYRLSIRLQSGLYGTEHYTIPVVLETPDDSLLPLTAAVGAASTPRCSSVCTFASQASST